MKSGNSFCAAAVVITCCIAFALFLLPLTALAEWTANRINGMVTVTDLLGEDTGPQIMRLGSGYYFIDWWHYGLTDDPGRSWYQILDSFGNPLLSSTGNLILPGATWTYGGDRLVPDGAGGVIVVFGNMPPGTQAPRIYGQRFNSYGQPLWGPTGLPLAEWPDNEALSLKDVTSDNNGSFFIAYNAPGAISELNAQKFNVEGQRLWGDYGVSVCTAPGSQIWPQIVADDSGGALVLWEDSRTNPYSYYLYAQHLSENGIPSLTPNGEPLHYPGTTTQLGVGGLEGGEPDGENGGVFVYITGAASNLLRVIRVNSQGQTQWVWDNGIYAFHGVDDFLKHPVDGTIWVSANDNRTGSDRLYLYHLDLEGQPLFNPTGIIGGEAMAPTSDGIITFETVDNALGARIIAKRFNGIGNQIWESTAALARLTSGGSPGLISITSSQDGNDGAVITMLDLRLQPYDLGNIAAQRVQWNGRLGNPTGPQPPVLTQKMGMSVLSGNLVQFALPQAGQVKLELFDLLGRKIATLKEGYQPAGTHNAVLNNLGLPAGVYFVKLKAGEISQVQKLVLMK